MTNRLHPLNSIVARPERLNNPMGYEPHPLCIEAMDEVQRYLLSKKEWQEEINNGKMFGVLVVEDKNQKLGFLAAFSGLLADNNDWDYFVPPVFDFLQPDGHFKKEEEAISAINEKVKLLECHPSYLQAKSHLKLMKEEMENDIMGWKAKMVEAKRKRDIIRQTTTPNMETMTSMQRESQWMKAELHRKRQQHNQRISQQHAIIEEKEDEIRNLKNERKRKSDALQQWLFSHFVMRNAKGEERDLLDIFASTTTPIPPSGSGECCAPKLLQYAFTHLLRPLCIAEFWWGKSPVGEIRKHLHFYPACRGKCLPILNFMLQGLDVEENIHAKAVEAIPKIVYEDEWLIVVDKPAGMLSIPGKQDSPSIYDFVKKHCPEAEGPLIVHRLDMSTSGLMLIAKTKKAHQYLQAQFQHRKVMKTYLARLEHEWPATATDRGIISLPLRPDPLDRPRQMVDKIKGKPAITMYEKSGISDVILHPKTGRTHQLRVHCAHQDGLGNPILGDTLYGTSAERLFLHASQLTITHPHTKETVTFHSPCPWE